jgi:hypothetical protein
VTLADENTSQNLFLSGLEISVSLLSDNSTLTNYPYPPTRTRTLNPYLCL